MNNPVRPQCEHIYRRTSGELTKGTRCPKKGREDVDGKFRCYRHKKIAYEGFLEKRRNARQLRKINMILKRLQAIAGYAKLSSHIPSAL